MSDPRIARLRRRLARHAALSIPAEPGVQRAAVALVVRPEPRDLELLLIERTVFEGDPWSGHMAFPGGRRDPEDPDPLTTAIREAHEEVAIDLRTAGFLLGALDDVQPGMQLIRIVVSPFVFAVPPATVAVANHEVESAVWVPLRELRQPGAVHEYLHEYGGDEPLRFPALTYGGYVIWGLTHRILSQFLERSAADVPDGRDA